MSDERPRPQYGEYADVPPVPPVPPADPVLAVAAPTRRTWDVALSTALLLLGVFDVVTGFADYADLGAVLSGVAAQQGVDGFASVALADEVGGWLNITRVVILAIAIGGTLLLLRRNRLAFWLPLAGGVIAGGAVAACVIAIFMADPAFLQYVLEQTAP